MKWREKIFDQRIFPCSLVIILSLSIVHNRAASCGSWFEVHEHALRTQRIASLLATTGSDERRRLLSSKGSLRGESHQLKSLNWYPLVETGVTSENLLSEFPRRKFEMISFSRDRRALLCPYEEMWAIFSVKTLVSLIESNDFLKPIRQVMLDQQKNFRTLWSLNRPFLFYWFPLSFLPSPAHPAGFSSVSSMASLSFLRLWHQPRVAR